MLNAISVARSDTNAIYAGSAQGRAMVSTDGGQNWTDVTAGLPNRTITWFAIDNADPAVAYVSVSGFGLAGRTHPLGAAGRVVLKPPRPPPWVVPGKK